MHLVGLVAVVFKFKQEVLAVRCEQEAMVCSVSSPTPTPAETRYSDEILLTAPIQGVYRCPATEQRMWIAADVGRVFSSVAGRDGVLPVQRRARPGRCLCKHIVAASSTVVVFDAHERTASSLAAAANTPSPAKHPPFVAHDAHKAPGQ